ncbi:transferrin-binding protein-like solute binding protein [Lonepinella sp. BR2271]|uniref:transferrin-binding protein-like solute binding protein n=1 Tax=Lonepinella sp. BR2271 TaxID=3434550 RepID=UPI003F6DE1FE
MPQVSDNGTGTGSGTGGGTGSGTGNGSGPTVQPSDLVDSSEAKLSTAEYPRGKIAAGTLTVTGSYAERLHGGKAEAPINQSSHAVADTSMANTEHLSLSKDTEVVEKDEKAVWDTANMTERLAEARKANQDFFDFSDGDRAGSNKWGYLASMRIYGTNLDTAQWGMTVATSDGSKKGDYVYAQGYATDKSQIPNAGSATYKGRAILSVDEAGKYYDRDHNNHNHAVKNIRAGDAQFEVDFANKSLAGTITPSAGTYFFDPVESNNFDPISLSAKIEGNRFTGTKDGTATNGQFYGENAQEMAGVFSNTDKNLLGSYGARKATEGDTSGIVEPEVVPEVEDSKLVGVRRSSYYTPIPDHEKSHYQVVNDIFDVTSIEEYGERIFVHYISQSDENRKDRESFVPPKLDELLKDDNVQKNGRNADYSTVTNNLVYYDGLGYIYVDNANNTYLLNLKEGTVMRRSNSGSNMLYYGTTTPKANIPTEGEVSYKGLSSVQIIRLTNKEGEWGKGEYTYNSGMTGTVDFKADFANKKITGTVTPDAKIASTNMLVKNIEQDYQDERVKMFFDYAGKDIKLTSNMNGASFAGTDKDSGYTMKGIFVGDHADEMIGEFHKDGKAVDGVSDHVNGVFGATKQ